MIELSFISLIGNFKAKKKFKVFFSFLHYYSISFHDLSLGLTQPRFFTDFFFHPRESGLKKPLPVLSIRSFLNDVTKCTTKIILIGFAYFSSAFFEKLLLLLIFIRSFLNDVTKCKTKIRLCLLLTYFLSQ